MGYPRFQLARAHKYFRRTSGDLSSSATAWTAVDTGLDLTLEAQAGDVIEYGVSAMWGNGAVEAFLDVATMVSGSPTTSFGTGAAPSATSYGVTAWYASSASGYTQAGGSAMLVLTPADIASGSGVVTLRLFRRQASATARVLYADADAALQVWAKNLGPMDPN